MKVGVIVSKLVYVLVLLLILLIEVGIGIWIYNLAQWLIFPYIIGCVILDIPLVEELDEE